MSILPASRLSSRNFRRPLRPTRITPRPASFAEGVEPVGLHSPIDARTLPTIDGAGLTAEEASRVTGARNQARYASEVGNPDATASEVETAVRLAATDELRLLLRERPAAPRTRPERFEPTEADWADYREWKAEVDRRDWLAAIEMRLSPEEEDARFLCLDLLSHVAFEDEVDPFDPYLYSVSAFCFLRGELDPTDPELSDDRTDSLLVWREGVGK